MLVVGVGDTHVRVHLTNHMQVQHVLVANAKHCDTKLGAELCEQCGAQACA
jgi:hypothetical protein